MEITGSEEGTAVTKAENISDEVQFKVEGGITMKRLALLTVVTMTLFLCLSGLAVAQDKTPDATLTMSEGQVAFGIGFSWGKGVLTYQGKEYPFKVKGLSVVDIGITKATSSGKVYNLKKLEDFNGNYTAASAEGTLAGGAGALTMKNQNGVVIDLRSTTAGVNLKLSVEGVSLTLEK
jgi:hypothetical protein